MRGRAESINLQFIDELAPGCAPAKVQPKVSIGKDQTPATERSPVDVLPQYRKLENVFTKPEARFEHSFATLVLRQNTRQLQVYASRFHPGRFPLLANFTS